MLLDPAGIKRLPVSFMNADHADEARLLNAAAEAVQAFRAGTAGAEQVAAALGALYLHTRAHFAGEEAAMTRSSFPAYTFHRAEHVRILEELGQVERTFREGRDAEALAANLATVPGWLEEHIRTMDAVTARYLAEWGE
jgi:hemerythrin